MKDEKETVRSASEDTAVIDSLPPKPIVNPKFMKIRLTVSDEYVLYESNSLTVPNDSDDASKVLAINTRYKYLTMGKGKNRITCDAETQTINTLLKSRSANTDRMKQSHVGTFVSNYDMFDTYEDLGRRTQSLNLDPLDTQAKLEITTYSRDGNNEEEEALRYNGKGFFISLTE